MFFSIYSLNNWTLLLSTFDTAIAVVDSLKIILRITDRCAFFFVDFGWSLSILGGFLGSL